MNESGLREIPDGTGYSVPLALSVAVHVLLGCLFWIGPEIHQTSTPPANAAVASAALPLLTSGAPISKTETLPPVAKASATPEQSARHAAAKNLPAKAEAGSSAKRKNKDSTQLAALPAERKQRHQKRPVAANKESGTSAAKRVAKAGPVPSTTKRQVTKQSMDRTNAMEKKRLDSMREAELRRISQGIS